MGLGSEQNEWELQVLICNDLSVTQIGSVFYHNATSHLVNVNSLNFLFFNCNVALQPLLPLICSSRYHGCNNRMPLYGATALIMLRMPE